MLSEISNFRKIITKINKKVISDNPKNSKSEMQKKKQKRKKRYRIVKLFSLRISQVSNILFSNVYTG